MPAHVRSWPASVSWKDSPRWEGGGLHKLHPGGQCEGQAAIGKGGAAFVGEAGRQSDGPACLEGTRGLHTHHRASTLGAQGRQGGEDHAHSQEEGEGNGKLHGCVCCACGAEEGCGVGRVVVGSRGMGRIIYPAEGENQERQRR